jgi:hypothetical protein
MKLCVVVGVTLLPAFVDVTARILRRAGYLTSEQTYPLSVTRDHSYGEILGYVMLAASLVCLLIAAYRNRDTRLPVVASVIGFILIDDMLMIHDGVRDRLGSTLFSQYDTMTAAEMGELLYFAVVGSVIGTALLTTYRNAPAAALKTAGLIAVPVFIFAGFAVAIDGIDQILYVTDLISGPLHAVLTIIEDGGETLACGLILVASWIVLTEPDWQAN